ncbi:MAG TPA: zinc ribbon domain-containing protein [Gemmatimonadales bacterium]|nr:zinc ribbon domain-containing protein [Gemmatimonadales bacterium]
MDNTSNQAGRFRRAAKNRHPHRNPATPKRTLRPEHLRARQPADPEWAEYVDEILGRRCYFCDFANPPEAAECEECGNALEIVCPECGYARPNNPEVSDCVNCGYPLRVEEFDPRNLVTGSGSAPTGWFVFAPVIAALVLAALLLLAFGRNDPGGPLTWIALVPVTLIFVLIFVFVYVRAKRQNTDNQDT